MVPSAQLILSPSLLNDLNIFFNVYIKYSIEKMIYRKNYTRNTLYNICIKLGHFKKITSIKTINSI
jgi:hypothetical protein